MNETAGNAEDVRHDSERDQVMAEPWATYGQRDEQHAGP